jgi:anthranilate/para-aminobenzoate synthase component I
VFDLDAIHVRLDGPGWAAPFQPGRATCGDQTWDDPLAGLAWMADHCPAGHRWVGYLSYDLGRWFERLLSPPADDLGLPLFAFTLHADAEEAPDVHPGLRASHSVATPNFTRSAYESAVARAVEYIGAGDVFQANLSQRFTVRPVDDARSVYARLPPASYGAFLNYGRFAVVSNSPELFLRLGADGRVTTRPIKGTRPVGPGMAEQLRDSAKDAAELHMIVDLERNDLGRVCEVGSVRVTQPRTIEAHPTVLHGVATVKGQLRPGVTLVDLLRATFPGGSVTGAPKVRAMQIIDELEPVRRGPYCGAIGYLAGDGSAEFNVAIRTMTIRDGTAYVPVGGGIVADSDPAAEYDETIVKATAMFAALGVRG